MFLALRNKVIPVLKSYPYIKIWHAGCATGEEAYSLAIVILEEDLDKRTTFSLPQILMMQLWQKAKRWYFQPRQCEAV